MTLRSTECHTLWIVEPNQPLTVKQKRTKFTLFTVYKTLHDGIYINGDSESQGGFRFFFQANKRQVNLDQKLTYSVLYMDMPTKTAVNRRVANIAPLFIDTIILKILIKQKKKQFRAFLAVFPLNFSILFSTHSNIFVWSSTNSCTWFLIFSSFRSEKWASLFFEFLSVSFRSAIFPADFTKQSKWLQIASM